jgi:hypothetical protein
MKWPGPKSSARLSASDPIMTKNSGERKCYHCDMNINMCMM